MSDQKIPKSAIHYQAASFLLSAKDLAHCPIDLGNEVAFVGRSNVGKSSAINVLTQQKKLARTSKTPGRTQHINFFTIDERCRLVDLPGYGYARVPHAERDRWKRIIEEYLGGRQSLKGLILLMDIRRPFTELDEILLEWCEKSNLPVHILLTKSDKLARGAAKNTFLLIMKKLEQSNISATVQLFSSLKRTGLAELLHVLDRWLSADFCE